MNQPVKHFSIVPAPADLSTVSYRKQILHFVFCGLLVSLLFVTSPVMGQSLSDLQHEAVQNRALIQKYRLALESAQREEAYQKGNFWPAVNLGYRANSLDEATPIESRESSRLGGAISYNLFNGFRDQHTLAAAKHATAVQSYLLDSVAQDLQLDIALNYLNLYEKKAFVRIVDDQLALIEKRLADTESRFEVGLVSKNEVLRITVEKNEVLQQQRQAAANVQKSRNQLAFATGSPIKIDPLPFTEFSTLPSISAFDAFKTTMLENRSEINAQKKKLALLEEKAKAVRFALWPTADISAGYNRFGDDFFLDKEDPYKDETRVQLNLNMNLFDGFQKYERIKQARLVVDQAKLDLTEIENQLLTELENRFLDLGVAHENLTVAQSAISEAEENVRITEEAFNAGVETATNMLDAILNLSTARFNETTARNSVFRNQFLLQRTIDGFPAQPIKENQSE